MFRLLQEANLISAKDAQALLRERIHDGLKAWNAGDIARLVAHYAENVVLSSPLVSVEDSAGSKWIEGREEVARHKLRMWQAFPKLRLIDILSGAGYACALFDTGRSHLAMVMEPDQDGRPRRIMIFHGTDIAPGFAQ